MRPRRCVGSGSTGGRSIVHVDRASGLPSRSSASCVAAITAEMRGDAPSVSRRFNTPAAVSICATTPTRSVRLRASSISESSVSSRLTSSADAAGATTVFSPGHAHAARSASASSMLTRTHTRWRARAAAATVLPTSPRAVVLRDGCTSVVRSRHSTSASPLSAPSAPAASSAGSSSADRASAACAGAVGVGSATKSYSPLMAARATATSSCPSRRLASRSGHRCGLASAASVEITTARSPNTMPSMAATTPSPAAPSCNGVPGPASRLSAAMSAPSTTVV